MQKALRRLIAAAYVVVAALIAAPTMVTSVQAQQVVQQTSSCLAGTIGAQVTISDEDFAWMLRDVRFHGKWRMGNYVGDKHPNNGKFRTQVYVGQTALVCLPESTPYKMLLLDLTVPQFRGPKGGKYWMKIRE